MNKKPLCTSRSPKGFYCLLLLHADDTMCLSLDNTRMWKESPGAPVRWRKNKALVVAKSPTTQEEVRGGGGSCPRCGALEFVQISSCKAKCGSCGLEQGGCS